MNHTFALLKDARNRTKRAGYVESTTRDGKLGEVTSQIQNLRRDYAPLKVVTDSTGLAGSVLRIIIDGNDTATLLAEGPPSARP